MTIEQPSDGRPRSVLGGYVVSRCPVRTQLDVLRPREPAPPLPEVQLRLDHGVDFENHIANRLRAVGGATFIDRTWPNDRREGETLEAMRTGETMIVGGRLPTDLATRRVGEPDVLVRFGTTRRDGTWRYLPVDIKNHRTLTPRTTNAEPDALVSQLKQPMFERAHTIPLLVVRHRRADALQLAHYRRMLQQVGHETAVEVAGIIGISEHIAWYHLDRAIWKTPARSQTPPTHRNRTGPDQTAPDQKLQTSMEVYDFEFDVRCEIATQAELSLEPEIGPDDVDRLVEPMWCPECPACPWRPHCEPILREGDGDTSLIPRLDHRRWRELRDLGIRSRRDLVDEVPESTARLAAVFEGTRIERLKREATRVDGATPIDELVSGSRQRSALTQAGIATAADIALLPEISERLTRSTGLHTHVVAARAALSSEPFLFLDDLSSFAVDRADIEIDIDMENSIDDRVYLWGALITDRTGPQPQSGYRPAVDWNAMIEPLERSLFEDFWSWLSTIRSEAARRSLSLRAYCWHAGAENRRLRELSSHDEKLAAEVADFIGSDAWIDLEHVWRSHATTGESSRLKDIAPLAGFSWRAPDADGGLSVVYYERAAAGDRDAQQWLLGYNEDDCRATLAVRDFMESAGSSQAPEM